MDIRIDLVSEERFADAVRTVELAFGATPTEEDIAYERSHAELDRSFAAFDGDVIVGVASTFTMRIAVPGGDVTAGFVTGVGVRPSHRRRGVNAALMRRQLDDARERGEPFEVLYASEGGIYGRFGYGLATYGLAIDVETSRTAYVRGFEPAGTVRLLEREEALEPLLELHRAIRVDVPGMVELDRARLEYTLRDHGPDKDLPYFFAFHHGDAGADGYVIYRVRHDWRGGIPGSRIAVRDLQALDPRAYADLWRFVFDVDLVANAESWNRPLDEPLFHLLQEPRRLRATVRDGLWLRPIDLARSLEGRRYSASGVVVLDVRDRFCPWNEGRYALEVADDGSASCSRSAREPDLVCSVNEVASAYLGGSSFARLARAGLVEERTSGAARRADSLFAWDRAPWCPYIF